jgi:hypothetical protein
MQTQPNLAQILFFFSNQFRELKDKFNFVNIQKVNSTKFFLKLERISLHM